MNRPHRRRRSARRVRPNSGTSGKPPGAPPELAGAEYGSSGSEEEDEEEEEEETDSPGDNQNAANGVNASANNPSNTSVTATTSSTTISTVSSTTSANIMTTVSSAPSLSSSSSSSSSSLPSITTQSSTATALPLSSMTGVNATQSATNFSSSQPNQSTISTNNASNNESNAIACSVCQTRCSPQWHQSKDAVGVYVCNECKTGKKATEPVCPVPSSGILAATTATTTTPSLTTTTTATTAITSSTTTTPATGSASASIAATSSNNSILPLSSSFVSHGGDSKIGLLQKDEAASSADDTYAFDPEKDAADNPTGGKLLTRARRARDNALSRTGGSNLGLDANKIGSEPNSPEKDGGDHLNIKPLAPTSDQLKHIGKNKLGDEKEGEITNEDDKNNVTKAKRRKIGPADSEMGGEGIDDSSGAEGGSARGVEDGQRTSLQGSAETSVNSPTDQSQGNGTPKSPRSNFLPSASGLGMAASGQMSSLMPDRCSMDAEAHGADTKRSIDQSPLHSLAGEQPPQSGSQHAPASASCGPLITPKLEPPSSPSSLPEMSRPKSTQEMGASVRVKEEMTNSKSPPSIPPTLATSLPSDRLIPPGYPFMPPTSIPGLPPLPSGAGLGHPHLSAPHFPGPHSKPGSHIPGGGPDIRSKSPRDSGATESPSVHAPRSRSRSPSVTASSASSATHPRSTPEHGATSTGGALSISSSGGLQPPAYTLASTANDQRLTASSASGHPLLPPHPSLAGIPGMPHPGFPHPGFVPPHMLPPGMAPYFAGMPPHWYGRGFPGPFPGSPFAPSPGLMAAAAAAAAGGPGGAGGNAPPSSPQIPQNSNKPKSPISSHGSSRDSHPRHSPSPAGHSFAGLHGALYPGSGDKRDPRDYRSHDDHDEEEMDHPPQLSRGPSPEPKIEDSECHRSQSAM